MLQCCDVKSPNPTPTNAACCYRHIKSRCLLDTEEIVRTSQAWRSERTRWFCTNNSRHFLGSSGSRVLHAWDDCRHAMHSYSTT